MQFLNLSIIVPRGVIIIIIIYALGSKNYYYYFSLLFIVIISFIIIINCITICITMWTYPATNMQRAKEQRDLWLFLLSVTHLQSILDTVLITTYFHV